MKNDDGPSGLSSADSLHLIDGKYSIKDLVDMDRLRALFEDFSKATGFTTGFVSYPEQEVLIATGWRDICTRFHRPCPTSVEFCKESNIQLTARLRDLKELNIQECGNGLVDGATPVVIRGRHLASLATGQVLLAPPDPERFKKQAEQYGFDTDEYLAALAQVPVTSEERIRKALSFLSGLAVVIAEEGLKNLQLRESGEVLEEKITAYEQASEALRKSEEDHRLLIQHMHAAVAVFTPDFRFLLINAEAARLLGVSAERLLGESVFNSLFRFIREDGTPIPSEEYLIKQVARSGQSQKGVAVGIDRGKKKGIVWTLATAYPEFDSSGRLRQVVVTFVDVTERRLALEALIKSEEKFRFLFTTSRDAILLMDHDRFLDCNNAALKLFGYPDRETMLGKRPGELSAPVQACGKDSFTAGYEHIESAFAGGSHFFEWRHQRFDGTIFDTEVSLSVCELDGRRVLQVMARDISNRKQMEREILEIREFEKRRLGRDLQDDLCQRLGSILGIGNQLHAELVNLGLKQAEDARHVTELIGKSIDQTRNLARGLSPLSLIGGGLVEALEAVVVNTESTFRIPCVFECRTPLLLTDEKLASHLYRIAQEALNNAAKHSNASRISVSLEYDHRSITLVVADDGKGGATLSKNSPGAGMHVMSYRANQIGATLAVNSKPGLGTTVTCSLPLPAQTSKLLSNLNGDSLTTANFLTLKKIGLTGRECEVLHWIAQGKRDAEIGTILSTSLRTINHHVGNILKKLGVETRTAASTRGIELLMERG